MSELALYVSLKYNSDLAYFTYVVSGVVLRQILSNSIKFQTLLFFLMSLLLHDHLVLVFNYGYLRLVGEQLVDFGIFLRVCVRV